LKRFAEEIGFSIQRKTLKLRDGLTLIADYEARARSAVWKQKYSKIGGEWVRLESAPPG
jgi:hypothetical protein